MIKRLREPAGEAWHWRSSLSKDVHSPMAKAYSAESRAETHQSRMRNKSYVDNPVFVTGLLIFGGILIALGGTHSQP
jgi:hypothetical protein